nr:DUF6252 family protein [Paraflavitalea speifideiaquila]
MTIGVQPFTTSGTFNIGAGALVSFAHSAAGNYTSTSVGSNGSLVVTSVTNNRIKGTFSFVVFNGSGGKVTIENGAFDCPLIRY